MDIMILFVVLALLWFSFVVAEGLDEVTHFLDEISNSLDVLANHLEHSCDKCKAEAKEETSD